jgi:1,4-dihydroxy-2-naphthoate octaprenyltransferase
MSIKSTLIHFKLLHSFFLLPVYFFALSISPNFTEKRLLWSFVIIHSLLYPASNGYSGVWDNSKNDVASSKSALRYLSLVLIVIGVAIGYFKVSPLFTALLIVYFAGSMAYHHPSVHIRNHKIADWLIGGFFHGTLVFWMCYIGINGFGLVTILNDRILIPGILSGFLLVSMLPLNKKYKQEENKHTIPGNQHDNKSALIYAIILFISVSICFVFYFQNYFSLETGLRFLLYISPIVLYILVWFLLSIKNPKVINHRYSLWLKILAATFLNIFFIRFFIENTHIDQLF